MTAATDAPVRHRPPRARSAVTLTAARLLRMPVGSVKTRLSRAKAHLRAALAEGLS